MKNMFFCPTSEKDDSQPSTQCVTVIAADDILQAREYLLEHIELNSDDNYIYHIEDITINAVSEKYKEIFDGIHKMMVEAGLTKD